MFGNLKSKLGEVTDLKKYTSPQLLGSLSNSRQRSGQHTPGSQTPSLSKHSRQSSVASLQNLGLSPENAKFAIKEEDEISKGSLHDDYNQNQDLKLQEQARELEKLRHALEVQQDTALQRLNSKDLEWKSTLEKENGKTLSLEMELEKSKRNEEALHYEIKLKNKEILKCNKILSEKDDMLKGMEEKIASIQENYDLLEGHGIQEVSKIKHLLLSTSIELEANMVKLEEKSKNVKALQQRITLMGNLEDRMHILSEEKMELETQIAGLGQKLTIVNAKLENEEEHHNDAIKLLEEKVSLLQQRHCTDTLEESDKNLALIRERETLEHNLEETRLQLRNIKTSWSEKISALENQIQNLNSKTAEDQCDLKFSTETIERLKFNVSELETTNQSMEESMIEKENNFEKQENCLEENIETLQWQLKSVAQEKDKELKDLRRTMNMKEEANMQLKEKLEQISANYSDLEKEAKELDEQLSSLTEKYALMQDKNTFLQSSYSMMQENLSVERNSSDKLTVEYETVKSKLGTLTLEKSKLTSKLDSYVVEVNDYRAEKCQSDQDIERLQATITVLENQCLVSQNKCSELTNSVQKLDSEFESRVEQSSLVASLRTKLKTLEDDLEEKKQMIKVQSQRLADMKKTFQREIKRSTESDFITETTPLVRTSPRPSVNNHHSIGNYHSVEKQNGSNIVEDFVNIEYLKHVIIKFLTSREYEAVQLTRAVSTLLHMTREEEDFLRSTLEYRMSWFGTKPNTGIGQEAKIIPHSQ